MDLWINIMLIWMPRITVAVDKINPLKWMGWEGPTLSSLDVTLINAIEHSEKEGKMKFKNKEIEIWS